MPRKDFNQTIEAFVKSLSVAPERINEFEQAVSKEWDKRQALLKQDEVDLEGRIQEQRLSAGLIMDKMKVLSSATAIKYMEEELIKTEDQIATLTEQKEKTQMNQPLDLSIIMKYVRYFLEHLEYLLLEQINPLARAGYFAVIFDKAPTYQEIISGTQDINKITGVNELFLALRSPSGDLAGEIGR